MSRLRRTRPVAQVLVDEPQGTVAAHVPDGRAVVLQGASEVIWHRIPGADEPAAAVSQLAGELAQETGLDVVVMEGQILALAAQLADEGLLEIL